MPFGRMKIDMIVPD